MTVSATSGYSSTNVLLRQLIQMRSQMETLSTQLSSGKKSSSYGGLGDQRGLSLTYRQQLAQSKSYSSTIDLVSMRLQASTTTLQSLSKLATSSRADFDSNQFSMLADGRSTAQLAASNYLQELTSLLNTDVGGRQLFSGTSVDTAPVEDLTKILDGDGSKAGLRTVMQQRRAADLGADGLGRLVVPAVSSDTVSVSEDVAGSIFGFKLSSVTSGLSNATVSGPSGSPPQIDIALTGQPQPGEKVTIALDLPDGTSTTVTLTASLDGSAAGSFAIGSSATETAENLRTALTTALSGEASTSLSAASGLQASREFFASGGNVAQRVDGPPYETATGLRDATSTDTVAWYKGDTSAIPARESSVAKVDDDVSIAYGMRADEAGFAGLFANIAALVADDFSGGTEADSDRSSQLIQRIRSGVSDAGNKIELVTAEIAAAYGSLGRADERQTSTAGTLQTLIDGIESVDTTETSVSLLALQTRMEASYQASSMIFKMTLTDYL